MGGVKTLVQIAGVAVGVLIVVFMARIIAESPTSVRGAVMAASTTPARELPLGGVEVSVAGDPTAPSVRSDASGLFSIAIPLRQRVRRGMPLSLAFRFPGYQPLELHGVALDKLCIARLTPLASAEPSGVVVGISHVVAKYSINTTTLINIGSAVKTFTVPNQGNTPCKEGHTCSPDGRWAATLGSTTLDAGPGNEFRDARAACIAGPCPFTKVRDTNLAVGHRSLEVSALNWSDTATFLVEAEVYRPVANAALRESYPVIFGNGLTFTLPAAAEGVSIQADLDRTTIVFPLGPALFLSWANCQIVTNKDQTRVYRCELKPGYRFS